MSLEFARDFIKYLPSRLLPAVVAVLAIPIFTHLLAPVEYGKYILVLNSVTALELFTTAWIGSSAVRFYAAHRVDGTLDAYYAALAALSLGVSVGVGVAGGMVTALVPHFPGVHDIELWRLGLVLFVLDSLYGVGLVVLRARQQVGAYTVFALWQAIGGLVIGTAIVLTTHSGGKGLVEGAVIGLAVALGPLAAATLWPGIRRLGRLRGPAVRAMTSFGVPLIPSTAFVWILNLSDRYIIGYFHGAGQVGLYATSYDLAYRALQFLSMLLQLAAGPLVVKVWEERGKTESGVFLGDVTRYFLVVGLPITVLVSVLASPLVQALAAPAYAAGYVVIPWVAVGALLLGLQWIAQQRLLLLKRTRTILIGYSVAAILNAGANWILVPRYGFIASAWTTFAAYAALLVLIALASARDFPWKVPMGTVMRAAGGCIPILVIGVTGAAVHVAPIPLIAATAGLGGASYVLIADIAGERAVRSAVSLVGSRVPLAGWMLGTTAGDGG